MTKQEFLDGKSFSLNGDYSDTTTYKYRGAGTDLGALDREYRMYNDIDTILLTDSIMNVDKVGNKMIHLYTFILGRKIVDKIRFEDMIKYISQKELV